MQGTAVSHRVRSAKRVCSAARHSRLSAEWTRNGLKLGHNGSVLAEACDLEGALMDLSSQRQWINALWFLFGLYWIVSAFKLKKTKRRETWAQRFRYVLPLLAAFYLLRPSAHYAWLGIRFVPWSDAAGGIGVALTAAGV